MVRMLNGLYIVATPIGNMGDISNRAIETLQNTDFIICENPNHSRKLMSKLGIKKKLIALHDHNEEKIIKNFIEKIKTKPVALISDAGSPLISDPGYKLVQHCIKENVFITTIPGASSIISALQLSGMPVNEFAFVGFAPKNKKKMLDFLNSISSEQKTVILFVSSHKIIQLLEMLTKILPNRNISVCKEITKLNEKIFYGLPENILSKICSNPKYSLGEFVIIIDTEKNIKNIEKKYISLEIEKIIKRLLAKFSLTESVEIVHKISYIEKKQIYKRALDIKNENN
jgi:16S rRNA (cytidine1402-2'-O)-methyltransferase